MAEFLPLCDLLFNVVSLASYFCDLVFDILVTYALYERGQKSLFVQCLAAIVVTTLATQFLSLRWYLRGKHEGAGRCAAVALHALQCGVLWRYARLLVPVRMSSVKREVRDLCVLRLVHGFLQAAPMLLLQLSLLPGGKEHWRQSEPPQHLPGVPPSDLVTVSASLSLFSVCWSLASFSKHVRHVDRLVLTWLGVVSQLAWRGGTVTSRALALAAYAATHGHWVLLVLALHWCCMFLWLALSARGDRRREGDDPRLGSCALVAAVYVLAYINLQEKPHKRTMAIFYVVMLLENCMLVGVWLATVWSVRPDHWELVPVLTVGLFFSGILFMLLYYRFFHVRRMLSCEKPAHSAAPTSHPPGVFNCRFAAAGGNPAAFYRKKKKPTTFVPPPSAAAHAGPNPSNVAAAVPFWRRPLPSSSENEGSSVGSRVNIHQKLQEKKQKQLAELRVIEEEIKQGKLVGPGGADFDDRQPIPRAKRHHHHVEPQLLSLASLNNLVSYGVNLNRRPPPRAPRSRTPELLLAPRYLYCDCSIVPDSAAEAAAAAAGTDELQLAAAPNSGGAAPSSDIESQVSLPRSYTLPREFKYYAGGGGTRQRAALNVASTNSSDGDVDSADDDDEDDEGGRDRRPPGGNRPMARQPPPTAVRHHLRRPFRHETKL